MDQQTAARIEALPDFKRLVTTRSRFGWTLAIVMLVIYYAFILLVAFAPNLMAMPVIGPVTLGFPLGLGVILSAVILTGVYVFRANGEFDDLTRNVVQAISRPEVVR